MTGIVFLAIVYFTLSSWYLSTTKTSDIRQIKNHVLIIAHDLWNLNNFGMQAYLDLVAETNHYKALEVLSNDGETFLKISGPKQCSIDIILLQTGLITLEQISFPVIYEKQEIGVLQGERYVRYVYPLFYIFSGLVFLVLTFTFIFYLIFNRRILEHQVKERTPKYQELVSLLPEMVLETGAEGSITFANDKALKCFGFHKLTETKHDCTKYIRLENGERGDRSIYLGSKNTDLKRKEYRAKSDSGILFPVLVRSAPIYRDNIFVGARMVIIDVTERKALEEQLTRDQKMKSIGIMAGGVAHDLNNILSGIINYPELLLHQLPKDSPLIGLVQPMKEAGMRAAAVVADLLTVARGVAATREVANLNDIILDYTNSPDQGKDYIDGCSGALVSNLGHGVTEIIDDLTQQMKTLDFAHPSRWHQSASQEAVELIAELTPGDLNYCWFVSGGSEAVESAIKMARQYFVERDGKNSPKHKLISRHCAYHGATIGTMSVGGSTGRVETYAPLLNPSAKLPATYFYRKPDHYTKQEFADHCANALESEILNLGAKNVLAFLAEPIVGSAGGALTPDDNYWPAVRKICDKYDILLIADEVMTGFGRTGKAFGVDHWDVIPDIIASAKGMAAGYIPTGGIFVKESIINTIKNGSGAFIHDHTYNTNPLSCRAVASVLTYIKTHNLIENVNLNGKVLGKGLMDLAKESPFIGDVRGRGYMWALEIVKDKASKQPFLA